MKGVRLKLAGQLSKSRKLKRKLKLKRIANFKEIENHWPEKNIYNFTISCYAFTSPNRKFPREKRDAMLPAPLRSLPRLGAQRISRPRSPTNCRPHLTNKSRVVAKTSGNVHKKHETSVKNLWRCPIFYVNESILYHFLRHSMSISKS